MHSISCPDRPFLISLLSTFLSSFLGQLGCYGQHPILWHAMGSINSETGVQQGDPLGPLLSVLMTVVQSCFFMPGTWMMALWPVPDVPSTIFFPSYKIKDHHWVSS